MTDPAEEDMSVDMDREMSCGYGRTTTWNKLLAEEMKRHDDTEGAMRLEFDRENAAFHAWSADRVYCSWEPGADVEVISMPRNPAP